MLSKALSTSVSFARLFDVAPDLAEFCQSLYPLMNAHADDFGREQGDALTVKFKMHPFSSRTPAEFERALVALDQVGLIHWYQADGKRIYQIVKFDTHQPGLHKRTKSQFPPFGGTKSDFREHTAPVPNVPSEENRTELNRREEKKTVSAEPPVGDSTPMPLTVLVYPTVGKGGTSWFLTDRHAAEWQALYPHLDVMAECRKALSWLNANPGRRKTVRGMPAFLVNWLNRATDSAPRSTLALARPGAPRTRDERNAAAAERTEQWLKAGGDV